MAQDTFLSFGLGFGVFLRVFVVPTPRSVPGLVWVFCPFYRGPGHVSYFLFVCLFVCFFSVPASFVLPTHPAQCLAMIWVIGPLY